MGQRKRQEDRAPEKAMRDLEPGARERVRLTGETGLLDLAPARGALEFPFRMEKEVRREGARDVYSERGAGAETDRGDPGRAARRDKVKKGMGERILKNPGIPVGKGHSFPLL